MRGAWGMRRARVMGGAWGMRGAWVMGGAWGMRGAWALMLCQQPCAYFLWDRNDLFRRVVVTDHPGPGEGHRLHFFAQLFFQPVIDLESDARKLCGGDGCPKHISVIQFTFELDHGIRHDQSHSGQVHFLIAVVPKELDADLVDQGKE